MASKHLAAVLPTEKTRFTVVERTTPEPGPHDILIEVKAVALNPVDYYQRDMGFPPVPLYPAVLGGDVAGVVAKVGAQVINPPRSGSRVVAMASSFYQDGSPDHGAFQQYALAQEEAVAALPDHMSFEEGCMIPLCFTTALTALPNMGVSLDTTFSRQDKQALLIWGGASSVGTFAIQTAKMMGFVVYATASPKHHEYLKTLGAHAMFDYRADDVVAQIVDAVRKDGVKLTHAHCVVEGSLQPVLDVLKQTKGTAPAKVASSAVLRDDHPTLDNTEIKFNLPSLTDKAERDEHIRKCFHEWLADSLQSGRIVPSPRMQVEEGGLEGLNLALDKLKAGVSCTKIVVPI